MLRRPTLRSNQVGVPERRGRERAARPLDVLRHRGVSKSPIARPVGLNRRNLVGESQVDLKILADKDEAVLPGGCLGHS